jgi:hypothetical protein
MDFPRAAECCATCLPPSIKVGRLHVSTLMKKMAIEAIYRQPNTSKPADPWIKPWATDSLCLSQMRMDASWTEARKLSSRLS